jgi:hypothetical protein
MAVKPWAFRVLKVLALRPADVPMSATDAQVDVDAKLGGDGERGRTG